MRQRTNFPIIPRSTHIPRRLRTQSNRIVRNYTWMLGIRSSNLRQLGIGNPADMMLRSSMSRARGGPKPLIPLETFFKNIKTVGSSAQRSKMAGPLNSRPSRSAPRDPENQTRSVSKSHNKHAVFVRGIPVRAKLLVAGKTLRINRYRPPQRTPRLPENSDFAPYILQKHEIPQIATEFARSSLKTNPKTGLQTSEEARGIPKRNSGRGQNGI